MHYMSKRYLRTLGRCVRYDLALAGNEARYFVQRLSSIESNALYSLIILSTAFNSGAYR